MTDTLFIEYVQPGVELEDGLVCEIIKISIYDAIRLQRANALKHNHVYKTNMDALYDAIAINWATLIEEVKTDDRNTMVNRRILDIQENLCEEINRGRR